MKDRIDFLKWILAGLTLGWILNGVINAIQNL